MPANQITLGGGTVVANEELHGERPAEDMTAEALPSPSRRGFVIGSALAAGLPGLLGAGLPARLARAAARKVLVVGMKVGSLRTLDPDNQNEYSFYIIGKNLYQTLVTFTGPTLTQILPGLANRWTASEGGRVYTFDLDPQAKFSDGSPVTPEDVVFSLRRVMYLKGPGSYLIDGIVKTITPSGPHQVRFELENVFVDMVPTLITLSLAITKASAVKAHGGTDASNAFSTDTATSWLDEHSAGSGPFVLDSWERGNRVVIKRNPNYWGPPAPVDAIIFQFVNDSNTQKDLLRRGAIDIALDLTPDLLPGLQSAKNVTVKSFPAFGVPFFTVHTSLNPIFKNPTVWSALKQAIDYEGMQKIYREGGEFTGSIVPPGIPHALPVSERLKEDLVAAKAALKEAGHPDGFEFKLTYASDEVMGVVPASPIAQKIRDDFQRIGVTANLDPVPYTEELSNYRAGKLEADIHFFGVDYPGWTDFLPIFAPGGGIALQRNGYTADFNAAAKQISDLTAKAAKTLDDKQQGEYVLEAQRLLNENGPFAWLFETKQIVAYRTDRIKRLSVNPIWYFDIMSSELA
jgi:peptide/nickel transport system substrate-binding protein